VDDNICMLLLIGIQGLSGGTTVSATMAAAHMAGIEVFVTGGIGGVHHDVQTCMITTLTPFAFSGSETVQTFTRHLQAYF